MSSTSICLSRLSRHLEREITARTVSHDGSKTLTSMAATSFIFLFFLSSIHNTRTHTRTHTKTDIEVYIFLKQFSGQASERPRHVVSCPFQFLSEASGTSIFMSC